MSRFSTPFFLVSCFFSLISFLLFHPLPLSALIFDDYSSTSTITLLNDAGATSSLSMVPGVNGNGVQLNYALGTGTGSYSGFSVDYSSQDFTLGGGNSFQFRYRAIGSSNTVEIKFADSDSSETIKSDKIVLKFAPVTDGVWRKLSIPFTFMDIFSDGNGSFDLTKVSKASLGVSKGPGGSGTLFFDKIELLKDTVALIDDFNDLSEPNFIGGTNLNKFEGAGGSASVSYATIGNDKAFRLDYDVTTPGAFSGTFLNLNTTNFQWYTNLSFRIRGSFGGEILKAKLESSTGSTELLIAPTYLPGGITTTFRQVTIPLSDFTGVNLSSVTVFTLVADGGDSGTIYLDDLSFVKTGESSAFIRVLDELDTDFPSSNWDKYNHVDASIQTSLILDPAVQDATINNRVYKIDYSFTSTPSKPSETAWAVIERPLQLSIAPFSNLKFQYQGTGSSNHVEFKIVDNDNTSWVKKFLNFSDTQGRWKTATVPMNQLSFFSAGNDNNLDLRKIKKIEFAISKGSGGNGAFAVDSLEGSESAELELISPDRLIASLKTVNNPFSPNGDGIKDEIYFIYTLAAASKVTLKIYSLEGNETKTVAIQEQSSGEQTLVWNGLDNNNERLRNGLYLFRLEAEGSDNRKDVIKQVVGVLR